MKAFTVVDAATVQSGQAKVSTPGNPAQFPKSKERHPFVEINPDDITRGELTSADLARLMKLLQDNSKAATEPFRTNPLLAGELHCNVALTNARLTTISHGLAEPYGHWWCVGARPGSAPFQAVEVKPSAGQPQNKYLVLLSSSTGTYDIVITGK